MKPTKILLLFALLCLQAMQNVYAYDFEVDGIAYVITSVEKNTVGVTSISGKEEKYSGDMVIPETVIYNGTKYIVSSIEKNAFYSCSSLTSIVIPEGVVSIEKSAFSCCSKLKTIKLPQTLISIGYEAFRQCSELETLNIPQSVTTIADEAFVWCVGLKQLVIPDNVISIGYGAFSACEGLVSAKLPKNLDTISTELFWQCYNLVSIDIPDGVTAIGSDAFKQCSALAQISLPNNLISIGNRAFNGCKSLTRVNIPEKVELLGEYSFSDCSGITTITIPNSVKSIGSGAFSGCSNLKECKLSPKIEAISDRIFYKCTNLEAMVIPENVTSIGEFAFTGCTKLNNVVMPNSLCNIGGAAFSGCTGFNAIDIPSNVISIGNEAFSGCSNVYTITIPDKVVSLGEGAFSGCYNLQKVTIGENVSSVRPNTFAKCYFIDEVTSKIKEPLDMVKNAFFDNVYQNAKLLIPYGTKNKYLACDGWKEFMNIQEQEKTGESLFLSVSCGNGGCLSLEGQTIRGTTVSIEIAKNQRVTIAIIPDEGYHIETVTLNGKSVKDDLYNNTYTIAQIKEDIDFRVEFARTATYLCLKQPTGSMDIVVAEGESQTVRIVPESGYTIHSVTFNGADVTSQLSADNVFVTPEIRDNSVLYVTYENGENPPVNHAKYLTIKHSENGAVKQKITLGRSYTYKISPVSGQKLAALYFNGVDVTSEIRDSKFTTPVLNDNATLEVEFEAK